MGGANFDTMCFSLKPLWCLYWPIPTLIQHFSQIWCTHTAQLLCYYLMFWRPDLNISPLFFNFIYQLCLQMWHWGINFIGIYDVQHRESRITKQKTRFALWKWIRPPAVIISSDSINASVCIEVNWVFVCPWVRQCGAETPGLSSQEEEEDEERMSKGWKGSRRALT